MSNTAPYCLHTALKHLHTNSAYGAVFWLTGGYYDELPNAMTGCLIPLVMASLRTMDSQVHTGPSWFQECWPSLKASAERVQFAQQTTPAVLTPVLLLLPLTIGVVIWHLMNADVQTAPEISDIAPSFTASMLQRLEVIGIQSPSSLAGWIASLDYHSSKLVLPTRES